MLIPPSPELQKKFINTDTIVKSGNAHLLPYLVSRYPDDYLDLETYEAVKRAMQFQ